VINSFVDCSPIFDQLDPEDQSIVLDVFKDILPQYLVYPSVIRLCRLAIPKTEDETRRKRIESSPAKDIWSDFRHLAIERTYVLEHAKITKVRACDNVKVGLKLPLRYMKLLTTPQCQKSDHKTQFQACAACLTTYYCSQVGQPVCIVTYHC
jgi:hypothetical protein